jgi:hypothetical protein
MANVEDKSKRRRSIFDRITDAIKGPEQKTNGKPEASATKDNATPTATSTSPPANTSTQPTQSSNEASAADQPQAAAVKKNYDVKGKTAIITGAGSGTRACPVLFCRRN